jgi:hypothetical protein
MDQLYEKLRNVTNSQGGGEHPINNQEVEG